MGKGSKRVEQSNGERLGALVLGAVQRTIESFMEAELAAELGTTRYRRTPQRRGVRHGHRLRDLGCPGGQVGLRVPRARLHGDDGQVREWHSTVFGRYQRRMPQLNEAILATYVAGGNTRRLKGALQPLLKGVPLSSSTVSRIAGQLKADLGKWQQRSLEKLKVVHMYLDAIRVKVRRAGRVVSAAVMVGLAVLVDGRREVVMMQMSATESYEGWKAALEQLEQRGLRAPVMCIVDGHAGLGRAVGELWPAAKVQRCTVHKQRNLLAASPKHCHGELLADYHEIVYAKDAQAAQQAAERFVAKWKKRCPAVAESFEEGGEQLLTFYELPQEQWKMLRTTNAIERVNGELRRRLKTQGAHPDDESVLALLYGLFACGQIVLRRVDGYRTLMEVYLNHHELPGMQQHGGRA